MENTEERIAMLNQISNPAFLVHEDRVILINEAAQHLQIEVGACVSPLFITGKAEYAAFTSGNLYVTMSICGVDSSVCITAMGENHLFTVEREEDLAELQSMALAAKALRSPLSNVMTVADRLFPLSAFDNDPEAQEQIAKINRGLYQMLRIVCNMSDAYRYASDKTSRTEVRDITAFMQEQFDLSAPLIAYSNITLHYLGPKEPIFGIIDSEKLERAIGNILSNAMKFTPPGGQILAKLVRKGHTLHLTVQDSGEGLPEHIRPTFYRRYARQPGLEDSRFGIGLGMVLVQQAAALHGGTVLTQMGQDYGLRLTMTIPIRQPSDVGVRSPMIHVDYAGDRDHRLVELSDCLPAEAFKRENIN